MQKARERLGAAGIYLSPRCDVFHSGSALGACHLAGTLGTTIPNTVLPCMRIKKASVHPVKCLLNCSSCYILLLHEQRDGVHSPWPRSVNLVPPPCDRPTLGSKHSFQSASSPVFLSAFLPGHFLIFFPSSLPCCLLLPPL